MRAIPQSVTVGGKRIRIRVVAELEAYGEYHHELAEIRLSGRTAKDPKILLETLRHEIVHAALAISGIGSGPGFPEESVVCCLDELFFPAYDRLLARLTEPPAPTKP